MLDNVKRGKRVQHSHICAYVAALLLAVVAPVTLAVWALAAFWPISLFVWLGVAVAVWTFAMSTAAEEDELEPLRAHHLHDALVQVRQ